MTREEFFAAVAVAVASERSTAERVLLVFGNVAARAVLERDAGKLLGALVSLAAMHAALWTDRDNFDRGPALSDLGTFRERVEEERARQFERWGRGNHSAEKWLCILAEELGEVSDALQEPGVRDTAIRSECVQVAAVCLRIVEEYTPEVRP